MRTGAIAAAISTPAVLLMPAGVFEVIPWNIALYPGIGAPVFARSTG
jgi:hypothetical protein